MDKESAMREITLEERKQLMLSIMDEIDAFCRENALTYFLVGGTLLGAVRHKGFIPWDDDMDIGLPRKDYERLIREFRSKSGNVRIYDYRNKEGYIWPCAKAVADNTVLYEQHNRRRPLGVFVDIFPFDGFRGTEAAIRKRIRKVRILTGMLGLKHLQFDRRRSILKNALTALGRGMYLIPDRLLISAIHSASADSTDFQDCDFVCCFTGSYGFGEINKAENFCATSAAEFEGRTYRIPVGYDAYLTGIYGDYMTPPPKDKQITHHMAEAYWKEKGRE
ncbi:MAG: LicD family protein [Oscillospiraceae bacterium]|nr:LicD family protein [Oscillospiraceae bacterium]